LHSNQINSKSTYKTDPFINEALWAGNTFANMFIIEREIKKVRRSAPGGAIQHCRD
jgi:hypothetical protein